MSRANDDEWPEIPAPAETNDGLDKELRDALKAIVQDGKYISGREFLIYIDQLEHGVDPMTLRLRKAEAKIRLAFIDDGYTKIDKRQYRDDEGRSYQQYTFNGGYVRVPEFVVMTGQEWYDKFIKEADHGKVTWPAHASNEYIVAMAGNVYLEAAKKAAGIE